VDDQRLGAVGAVAGLRCDYEFISTIDMSSGAPGQEQATQGQLTFFAALQLLGIS
jgi:hypothetical protein